MGERVPFQEEALRERFSEFVSGHAAEALLWFVVPQDGDTVDSFIDHVEFETDQKSWLADATELSGGEEAFYMNVCTSISMTADSLAIEYYVDESLEITDEDEEFSIITGIKGAHKGRKRVRGVGSLLDQLVALEKSGNFIPAYMRQSEF
jgi:hypothetical protein